jgi:hypothetical protein
MTVHLVTTVDEVLALALQPQPEGAAAGSAAEPAEVQAATVSQAAGADVSDG